MISFEIKLSFQSCQILFFLIEWQAAKRQGIKIPKGKIKEYVENEAFNKIVFRQKEFSHFVTHARILEREGLITKAKGLRYSEITRKGYLLAEILRIEFDEAQRATLKATKQQRLLKALKIP